jgi:hypothetical protein
MYNYIQSHSYSSDLYLNDLYLFSKFKLQSYEILFDENNKLDKANNDLTLLMHIYFKSHLVSIIT